MAIFVFFDRIYYFHFCNYGYSAIFLLNSLLFSFFKWPFWSFSTEYITFLFVIMALLVFFCWIHCFSFPSFCLLHHSRVILCICVCGELTCSAMSLFSPSHSLHRYWEVVVWDGAVSGRRRVQDSARQLWMDVLLWEQDQDHKSETSHTHTYECISTHAQISAPNAQMWSTRTWWFCVHILPRNTPGLQLAN